MGEKKDLAIAGGIVTALVAIIAAPALLAPLAHIANARDEFVAWALTNPAAAIAAAALYYTTATLAVVVVIAVRMTTEELDEIVETVASKFRG